MTVADRIRVMREEREWSQEELAHRCGWKGKTSVSRIECSGDGVTNRQVAKIAKAFGVRPAVIMGWAEEEPTYDVKIPQFLIEASTLPPERLELLEMYYEKLKGL